MNFFKIEPLAHALKQRHVSSVTTIMYAIIAFIMTITCFTVFTWLPVLYYLTFSAVKQYLEKQADPAPLNIAVFNHLDYLFLIFKLCILAGGIIFCLMVFRSMRLYTAIKRIICLFVPINIRLLLLTTILFLILFLLCGLYFGFQLLQLTDAEPETKSAFTAVVSKISPKQLIKSGWSQWMNYKKAELIFDHISITSYAFYLCCQIMSCITSALLFLLIAMYGKE